jgi:RNA polymerase sigma factor (sigma-70 family)
MADQDKYQLTPILQRSVGGDEQALNQLLGKIRPYLHSRIRQRRGPQPTEPLDESAVVQNSLLRIYRNIGRLRRRTVPGLLAWAGRIANNALIDALRQQANDPAQAVGEHIFDLAGQGGEGADPLELAERRARLSAALDRLPARQQQVVRWRFFEHLSDAEICRRLGDRSSVGAVRVLRCRALQNLRRLMEQPEVVPEESS